MRRSIRPEMQRCEFAEHRSYRRRMAASESALPAWVTSTLAMATIALLLYAVWPLLSALAGLLAGLYKFGGAL